MDTHPDFEGFLTRLHQHHVDYMLVGGYAVAFHGYPRFTKDLNVFFDASPENIRRLQDVLVAFGFSRPDVMALAFDQPGEIIRFGIPPVMIDLLNRIDGIEYHEAAPRRVTGTYGATTAYFVSKADLIRNKQATPRLKDKADAEELLS